MMYLPWVQYADIVTSTSDLSTVRVISSWVDNHIHNVVIDVGP